MTGWRLDPQGVVGVLDRVDASSADLATAAARATGTCARIVDVAGVDVIERELNAFVETYAALIAAQDARVDAVTAATATASALYEAGDATMARDTIAAAQAAWGWTS